MKFNMRPIIVDSSNTAHVFLYKNNDKIEAIAKTTEESVNKINYVKNLNKNLFVVVVEGIYKICVRSSGRDSLRTIVLAEYDEHTNTATTKNTLDVFSQKMLAHGNNSFVAPNPPRGLQTKTDLHTHFTGVLYADTLIKIALEYGIKIPNFHLQLLGFGHLQEVQTFVDKNKVTKIKVDNNHKVSLKKLFEECEEFKKVYIEALSIPVHEQQRFADMDRIYDLRRTFFAVKSYDDMKKASIKRLGSKPKGKAQAVQDFDKQERYMSALLLAMGEQNKLHGIEYSEISLTDVHNKTLISILEHYTPIVEKQTGVTLKFLLAIPRTACIEQQKDFVAACKKLSSSPIVAGFDVLGHETNSTKDVAYVLESLARHVMKTDPTLTIRAHAGESALFKDNVLDVLKIIKRAKNKLEETYPHHKFEYPDIRIGHGIHGVSPELLELIKETDATIEINITSNLALNNINKICDIPIKEYLEAGCNLVLGTDSGGVYQTDILEQAKLFLAAGGTIEQLKAMIDFEIKLIAKKKKRQKEKQDELEARIRNIQLEEQLEQFELMKYLKNFEQHYGLKDFLYTKDVKAQYAKLQKQKVSQITKYLKKYKTSTNRYELANAIEGKTPVFISGKTIANIKELPESQQIKIKEQIFNLISNLDLDNVYFVKTALNNAISRYASNVIEKLNENRKNKIPLVAYGSINMLDRFIKDPPLCHHLVLPKIDGMNIAKDEFAIAAPIVDELAFKQGLAVCIGGGAILGDVILDMNKQGVNLHLNNEFSISKEKNDFFRDCNLGFGTAKELIQNIYAKSPYLFKPGFNLENFIPHTFEKTKQQGEKNYERTR